ncbi:MAG: thioesterase family protein [Bacteroidia bacterium]
MFSSETFLRVRYAETDRMGYAYYGNYATYFEVARVEALRKMGYSYKDMEDSGIIMPVLEFSIKYFKPAYYDDELKIVSIINELPTTRLRFEHETYNAENILLNKAHVTLVIVNQKTMKPCHAPDYFMEALKKYF